MMIPIDQRYGIKEMDYILSKLREVCRQQEKEIQSKATRMSPV